jgi:hypothetical protein
LDNFGSDSDSKNGGDPNKSGMTMWVCSDCLLRAQPSSSGNAGQITGPAPTKGIVVAETRLIKVATNPPIQSFAVETAVAGGAKNDTRAAESSRSTRCSIQ